MGFRHILCAAVICAATPAAAQTLSEAIAAAYATNPEAAAARAVVRQIDEEAPLALSGMRPSVGLSGSASQVLNDRFGDVGRIWNGGVTLSQPVYEGGRVRASVSAADARIAAAQARLVAVEQAVIVDTVAAYADVLKSQAVVELNANQVRVLERELQASRDRFEVGDVTRTDVAQSEARLSAARAELSLARGQLVTVQQAYRRLVGRLPGDLAPLPPLPPLPDAAESARVTAVEYNPGLIAARFDEQAALADVRAAKAQARPSVGVSATAQYTHFDRYGSGDSGFNPEIGVSASLPLFTGGAIAARVRQAQARQSEMLEHIARAERLTTEAAVGSFTLVETADAVITSARTQVSANELAAEGVRQENAVGSRDILDVLNAEQELLNARVLLVEAERDKYVAAFQLLEAMGQADVVLASAPVSRYDSAANSRRVRGKWGEFSYDPDPRQDRERNHAPAPVFGPQ
ncbi:MAG: TolC family outer membrane protein [Sphingomonadaceae bacterium]